MLAVVAFASRAIAAFLLPNAEQDGYTYAEIISGLTTHLETGRFRITDLYGFWLPAFQLTTAGVNLCIHSPLVAGKIINAVCGAGTVMLVFEITHLVTRNLTWAVITFAMMLLDPLHLLYSAACMTDVPHACVVLISLWFALRRRWTGAALFAAVAGTIRVESWALLFVLPILEFLYRRRVPWLSLCILLVPPVAWLLTTYAATGHAFSYFQERARYHTEYLRFHAERVGFHSRVVLGDVEAWLLGANGLVTAGVLTAGGILIRKMMSARDVPKEEIVVAITYWWGMLALLAVAYVSKAQPVLLPRYGLGFLAVGLPVFAWTLQWCFNRLRSVRARTFVVIAILLVFVVQLSSQLPTIWNVQDDYRANQQIATVLTSAMRSAQGIRCFSDNAAVRVLSGLPVTRFLRSPAVPDEDAVNADRFINYLHNQNVGWLVFFPTEDSLPVKLFSELGDVPPPASSQFEFVKFETSAFGPDIWLYRLR